MQDLKITFFHHGKQTIFYFRPKPSESHQIHHSQTQDSAEFSNFSQSGTILEIKHYSSTYLAFPFFVLHEVPECNSIQNPFLKL